MLRDHHWKYLQIIILAGLCFACASKTPAPDVQRPEWFFNPDLSDKPGGVGIAGPHINGLHAQKKLAVKRALNELAKQLGVEVESTTELISKGSSDRAQTRQRVYSVQTVKGKVVRAKLKEIWQDPRTKELFVWMVLQ